MAEAKSIYGEGLLGHKVKYLRIAQGLTQRELASIAKVSLKAVDLLEQNQPLPLDDKRKILIELYARKISRPG